jgi:hypothetical protein
VSEWSWIVTPLEPFAVCAKCSKALRLSREHLVLWRGKNYHLACLLDQLTQTVPQPDPPAAENLLDLTHWGMLPP